MRRNSVWWLKIACTSAVVFLVGCQFPGFRSAQRKSPDHQERPLNGRQVAEVQLSLARSLELRGEIEPALNAYRQAIEKDPRRATGYWRMAVLQDRQGQVEESAALYQQALKLDSKNPDLLCDYGYSLYLQRRWAEAEERLRQAIALKPKHSRAHNHLGLVLAQTERADEA
ncbi:MAG: tetratricopeptide repeat protein, partial [Candidatus Saccharimonas sp.]|nr:tetratricopeptide repeat protein [Planctomycetaceae bacterium]